MEASEVGQTQGLGHSSDGQGGRLNSVWAQTGSEGGYWSWWGALEGLGREALWTDSGVARSPLTAPVCGRGTPEREGRQDSQGEPGAASRAS